METNRGRTAGHCPQLILGKSIRNVSYLFFGRHKHVRYGLKSWDDVWYWAAKPRFWLLHEN